MTLPTRTPTQAEVLAIWADKAARDIRVSMPCVVDSYNPATQTVNVHPQVSETYLDDNGVQQSDPLPGLNGVPVEWPSGGGMRVTFPLAAGDTGRVTFMDRSIDLWTGLSSPANTSPADSRRHDLSDAVFTPGLRVAGQTWKNASPSVVTIGSDTGAADFVATAQRVLTQLSAMASTFNAHTHVLTLTSGTGTAAPSVTTMSPSAPASATVQVLG